MAFLAGLWLATPPAQANIDLQWRPITQTVNVGDPVGVGLFACSDNAQNQGFSSVQVIMEWDPGFLRLTGNDDAGAVDWMGGSSFIPGDSFGINEADPPADGDGMWVGMVTFQQERWATPAGTLLTTITFDALAETPGTLVGMLADSSTHPHPPHPIGLTKMLNLQSQDVLGSFGAYATVIIVPEPACLALCALGLLVVGARRR